MIELLYLAIPIAIVVVIAVVSSMREHHLGDVRREVATFDHARRALERRTTSKLSERGARGAPE